MQQTSNNFDLPSELCAKPLALVGISGLDTVNNAIHKSIWEIFSSNRRVERAPVLFKLIGNDHEFPVIKPKRNSYDWYIPRGVLKRNWMHKHLSEIPALIVIFYQLDWNDTIWSEKMIECASRVQSMRAALEGRNTKICVVLLQNSLPLPVGEDQLASERANALCAACELQSTCLFVLPLGDHLQGYAVRLESAFYEFAQHYYTEEIKIVKSHKEYLNKSIHQNLFVRHQFKMGFLFELKQDIITAHKHYGLAYNNLLEIRIVDTNALEIRTVAGFINYKLCRLMFALNLPRDAISQFKSHIDRFKQRLGFQELAFEHYAWLSKQYAVFGDIFDEAVKLGLPALQTQHPGLYYQQAAQFAIKRKQVSSELCREVTSYPEPDPLETSLNMEFYGQRPWRPGKLSAEAPDPHLESRGIQALQYIEKQVNHSNIIIALYGLAISQFKTYRCPRTRRHLVLQMAEEYYNSHDYGKALTLLTHMLWDFHSEKWWLLMTDVLKKAIKCAFITANAQDYILLSLEMLSSSCLVKLDEKKRLHENLNRILKKQIPFGDPSLPHDILQNAIISWQPIVSSPTLYFSIDMTNNVACIETKARFAQKHYEVDQKVCVEIFIRSTWPCPLTFSKLSVSVNSPGFTSDYLVTGASLEFKHLEVKKFIVEFFPDPNDIMKEIQIVKINVTLGNSPDSCIDLQFAPSSEYPSIHPELLHFKKSNGSLDYDNVQPLCSTLIMPRSSKLNVKFIHAQPALLGEWYELVIEIDNEELDEIGDLNVTVALEDGESGDAEFSMMADGPTQPIPFTLEMNKKLRKSEKSSALLFMKSHRTGERGIQVKFTYMLNGSQPVFSTKHEVIKVPVMKAFEVRTRFLSTLLMDIPTFFVGEEFGVMPIVTNVSPWAIEVESTAMEFVPPIRAGDTKIPSVINGMTLSKNEAGTELIFAICDKVLEHNINVGQYIVKWRRKNGYPTTTAVPIIGKPSEWFPLKMRMNAPAHGLVRTPLVIEYHLHNNSDNLIQLEVGLEAKEGFMFAGYKQFMVSIIPKSTYVLKYNLYPLFPGSVALPKIYFNIPDGCIECPGLKQESLKTLIERSLPTHLYVVPQAKGNAKIPLDAIYSQAISTH